MPSTAAEEKRGKGRPQEIVDPQKALITFSGETLKLIDALAALEGISRAQMIRDVLDDYLDDLAAQEGISMYGK